MKFMLFLHHSEVATTSKSLIFGNFTQKSVVQPSSSLNVSALRPWPLLRLLLMIFLCMISSFRPFSFVGDFEPTKSTSTSTLKLSSISPPLVKSSTSSSSVSLRRSSLRGPEHRGRRPKLSEL